MNKCRDYIVKIVLDDAKAHALLVDGHASPHDTDVCAFGILKRRPAHRHSTFDTLNTFPQEWGADASEEGQIAFIVRDS